MIIESEDNLVKLIDENKMKLKKYNVDKVYPPIHEIKEEHTYQTNINTSEEIYDVIKKEIPLL